MKNSVKHITVSILIVTILFSTMGVSVNTLYCFCTGKSEISLFEIDHKCEKEPSGSVALPEGFYNLPPCCQKAIKKAACAKHGKSDHDCTKKSKKHLKADLKFLEIKKTELPSIELYAVENKVLFYQFFKQEFDISDLKSETLPRPPPSQYWGRSLLNFIQVYRC